MLEVTHWFFWFSGIIWFVVGYLCRVVQTYRILKAWDEVPVSEQIRASRLAGYWSYQTRTGILGKKR